MRIVLRCLLLALGVLVLPSLYARVTRAQVAKTETTATTSTRNPRKTDPRYAIGRGSWSAATVSLFNTWSAPDENPGRQASFYSPDRKKLVEVLGARVFLRLGGRTFDTNINNVTKHDAELGWAPDSTKFFVTWTESGELGPWHMDVYGVDGSGAHEFPKVEEPAREDFEQRVRKFPMEPGTDRSIWDFDEYCEPYHVIGGRWLNGSKEILLSVLIRNTGDCRYMSEFNVYRVNAVSGEILQRFTAAAAHKRFGNKYLPRITR